MEIEGPTACGVYYGTLLLTHAPIKGFSTPSLCDHKKSRRMLLCEMRALHLHAGCLWRAFCEEDLGSWLTMEALWPLHLRGLYVGRPLGGYW